LAGSGPPVADTVQPELKYPHEGVCFVVRAYDKVAVELKVYDLDCRFP